MRIDIGDLLKQKIASINLDFIENTDKYKHFLDENDVDFGDEIHFKGTLTNNEGVISLNGKLSYTYKTQCNRCLKEQTDRKTIKVNVSIIDSNTDNKDLEYSFNGNMLDLNDIIKDEILLNMPLKHICDENCQGICPICGANINIQKCSCKHDDIDPRFKILKELKFELDDSSANNH